MTTTMVAKHFQMVEIARNHNGNTTSENVLLILRVKCSNFGINNSQKGLGSGTELWKINEYTWSNQKGKRKEKSE